MRTSHVLSLGFVVTGFLIACSSSSSNGTDTTNNPSNPNPTATPSGGSCVNPTDCQSGVCTNSTCVDPTSTDGVKNGNETDIDCGGGSAPACGQDKSCAGGGDCLSGICNAGKCDSPSANDGVKNNSETDIDCGGPGSDVPRCNVDQMCNDASDCTSNVCAGGKCKAASSSDHVKNGDETDVDCGGAAPKCDVAMACKAAGDCLTGVCKANQCVSPAADDGVKNGGETDVDCGGPDAGTPRCVPGKICGGGGDCDSKVCNANTCAAPSPSDGVKNGTETDVDCGGAGNPKCGTDKTCVASGDCASDGCNFEKKCASHPSCTKLEGGYTCGPNESNGKQSDCCASAAVGGYTVDKYQITAGRMRAFLDKFNGNVRGWAAALPANKWNQAYTGELPTNYTDANMQLGPYYGKRACGTQHHTGHVFSTPFEPTAVQDFPQNVTDTKALNCVPWWLMSAFCVWDGGHLATQAELRAAYTNNGTTTYPWGNAANGYSVSAQNNYAVGRWSYFTPNPPAAAHTDTAGYLDIAFYVAPPGRRPAGYNATGHADMVGNLLEWVSDRDRQFVWKGSWENHAEEGDLYSPGANDPWTDSYGGAPWQWGFNIGTGREGDGRPGDNASVGYYGIGGRCAR